VLFKAVPFPSGGFEIRAALAELTLAARTASAPLIVAAAAATIAAICSSVFGESHASILV
jgi:hypothetical protein